MSRTESHPWFDRELSWLAFNGRVLQEARDARVPLFARLQFLAIYSSNLDEFFRVRVASLRTLLRLKKKKREELDFDPATLLREIRERVVAQQEAFGEILRTGILPDLEAHGIFLIDETRLEPAQQTLVGAYFEEHVRAHLVAGEGHVEVLDGDGSPFLEDRRIYLAVELRPRAERGGVSLSAEAPRLGLVAVPSPPLPRFVWIPGSDEHKYVMFLDDVIRANLGALFPGHDVGAACAVKLSRDAELYLEDEYEGDLVEKIRKGLKKRESGLPCRFLYDLHAPYAIVALLKERFGLEDDDLVQGGRYHNLHDFFSFPRFGMKGLGYPALPPLPHPDLEASSSLFEAVGERDRLLHFPYQSFGYVVRFLEEAACDPAVEAIHVTLYRAARDSAVMQALVAAAEAGKRVVVFVEVKARFDEASNLAWAERLEKAGVRTLYSLPGLKVHAKMILVDRREEGALRRYAYLGTGNLNEKTARVYADHGLLTADERLTADVHQVFAYLEGEVDEPACEHLLVAPFTLRKGLSRLLAGEVRAAREGRPARAILKMNSLEDPKMIGRLYEASLAGVRVDLIVRGICCLVPGVEGASENIRARSIVDRFLEHARIFIFHHDGDELLYLASADWMRRNLSHRVEVAFPIYDPDLRRELRDIVELQLRDDVKARLLDAAQSNPYAPPGDPPPVRAQIDTYRYLSGRLSSDGGPDTDLRPAATAEPPTRP